MPLRRDEKTTRPGPDVTTRDRFGSGEAINSNRQFLVQLETHLTHTKQTPQKVSNRHIWDPLHSNVARSSTLFSRLFATRFLTFNWNFHPQRGEYVTTRATGRPIY